MKRVLFIGDMHLGSKYAILKDGFVTKDGQKISVGKGFQSWAWQTWKEKFVQDYKDPDYLILMGDLTDGLGNINLGVDQLTTNLDEQVKMAIELLKMIKGSKTQIYGINGSGYHSGKGSQPDRQIIETLEGKFMGDAFTFEVEGKDRKYTFQISHGGSAPLVNQYVYLVREIKNAKDEKAENEVPMPDFLARAHQHTYLHYEESNIAGFVVPCWQAYIPDTIYVICDGFDNTTICKLAIDGSWNGTTISGNSGKGHKLSDKETWEMKYIPILKVYTLKGCHGCMMLKHYLNQLSISFVELDAQVYSQYLIKKGFYAAPVIEIDGELHSFESHAALLDLLKLKEFVP